MIAILSSYCDSYRSTAIINNNVYKAVMIALGVMRCEVLKIHIFKCLQTKMVIWSLRTSSKKNLLELVTGMLFMGVYFFCDQSNVDQFVKESSAVKSVNMVSLN